MKDFFESLKKRYHYAMVVFKELVKTDFQLRYQGSFLGMVWSVLKPLMLFAVMYVVFVKFLKFSDGTPTFPISLLCGTCLWSFFSESTSMGMQSIVGRGDLLRKVHFPNYIIVASTTMGSMISLGINLLVVILFRFLRPRALHLARIAGAIQHSAVVLPRSWRGIAARFPVCIFPRCGAYLGSRIAGHVLCDSYHLPDFHGGE